MSKLQSALALLDRFERGEFIEPSDAEKLLVQIFEACGYPVTEKGFVGSSNALLEVDCFIRAKVDGSLKMIAVEVKAGSRPAGIESVEQAFNLKTAGPFDRAMIVSRLGFSADALQHADTIGLGEIDLLGPEHLRNWISKQAESHDGVSRCDAIVRHAMRELAKTLAQYPDELSRVEWRDLERLLGEVFEGIGFDTRVTRSSKDGGVDLELTTSEEGKRQVYLVEVKHWSEQRPGISHLRKLVRVTAARRATAGVLLSSSGFTRPTYSGIAEFTTPVHLGGKDKIVSLCRTYYRLSSALWLEDTNLQRALFSGTFGRTNPPKGTGD
ncbi:MULTISPECIES: restriction endonuclease [unclassified Bradyrhizobium]|uniref:restriction endonuclease n=1 Tax=unclassified Bradyrhizobium TaxID=2631580 RepID=UPI002916BEE2|nr:MULTISPECIES: restriction endonuclease [unclassified Bradyrhizobium]